MGRAEREPTGDLPPDCRAMARLCWKAPPKPDLLFAAQVERLLFTPMRSHLVIRLRAHSICVLIVLREIDSTC